MWDVSASQLSSLISDLEASSPSRVLPASTAAVPITFSGGGISLNVGKHPLGVFSDPTIQALLESGLSAPGEQKLPASISSEDDIESDEDGDLDDDDEVYDSKPWGRKAVPLQPAGRDGVLTRSAILSQALIEELRYSSGTWFASEAVAGAGRRRNMSKAMRVWEHVGGPSLPLPSPPLALGFPVRTHSGKGG